MRGSIFINHANESTSSSVCTTFGEPSSTLAGASSPYYFDTVDKHRNTIRRCRSFCGRFPATINEGARKTHNPSTRICAMHDEKPGRTCPDDFNLPVQSFCMHEVSKAPSMRIRSFWTRRPGNHVELNFMAKVFSFDPCCFQWRFHILELYDSSQYPAIDVF